MQGWLERVSCKRPLTPLLPAQVSLSPRWIFLADKYVEDLSVS